MVKMPKVWEILKKFKNLCTFKGWRTSESEDWIEVDDKYHNFLWARDIHPTSFKKIVSNRKCVIREGLSYRVVEASCTAWLLCEAPSKLLFEAISENPELHDKVAIYDLSPLLSGKNLCVKLNYTNSPVFHEFENFLKEEFKVKLKSASPFLDVESTENNYELEEIA